MRTFRRPIAYLMMLWYLPACTSYRTTDLSPQEAVASGESVVVTFLRSTGGSTGYVVGPDGKIVEGPGTATVHLKEPWVRGDSLGGTPCEAQRNGGWRCSRDAPAWAAPLSSVLSVKTKQVNAVTTSMAVVGGLALGLFVTAAVAICTDDWMGQGC